MDESIGDRGRAARRPLKILVIDDDPEVTDSLSLLFSRWGHAVRVAHAGGEGLAQAIEIVPDLIFVDLGLPGIDGFEVIRSIRSIPSLQSTHVVVVTGRLAEPEGESETELSLDGYLLKPVEPRTLKALIGSLAV